MDNAINKSEIIKQLEKRIPFDKDIHGNYQTYNQILNDLEMDSKFIALSKIYPFEDYGDMDVPKKYKNWQLRCCVELYNMADKGSFTSYSENGLSWTRLSDGLSESLNGEIISKVGIPKSESSD